MVTTIPMPRPRGQIGEETEPKHDAGGERVPFLCLPWRRYFEYLADIIRYLGVWVMMTGKQAGQSWACSQVVSWCS